MTAPVRWWDDPDRGEPDVLVPCAWPHWRDPDHVARIAAAFDVPRPMLDTQPPPFTLSPDDGRTLLLRFPASEWEAWLAVVRYRNTPRLWDALPMFACNDRMTGASWRVYLNATEPAEFTALLDHGRAHVTIDGNAWALAAAECEPLVYDRWPRLALPDWNLLLGRRR